MLARLARYLERRWDFRDVADRVRDARQRPGVGSRAVFLSIFGMHALRLGSFNTLEAELNVPQRWDPWVGARKPSADTLGYALDRFDLAPLRDALARAGKQAKRGKVFRRTYPDLHWAAALDGIETYASRKRCCPQCLTRKVTVGGAELTEYYHRQVALQMIGLTPALILDAEPLEPGDTEVSAGLRLLERVRGTLPRFIDVLSLDAFYLQAPFVSRALELGYALVIVLKQEDRDLYQDAQGLFAKRAPDQTLALLGGQAQLWDETGLSSWPTLGRPVRVVRSLEHKRKRERVARQWTEREITEDWRWAVVFPDQRQPPAELVRRWGHARWDEETRGFGELTQRWHLDHCYRHHPAAMLACLLILFLAFFLTTVFFDRNLKPPLRKGRTRLFLARLLADDLARAKFAPFWSRPP